MLRPSPSIAIFGTPDDTTNATLTTSQRDIIAFTSLLACQRILLSWKSSTPPSATSWLEDVVSKTRKGQIYTEGLSKYVLLKMETHFVILQKSKGIT